MTTVDTILGTDSNFSNTSTIQFVPLYSLVNKKKHPTKRKLSVPNFQSLSSKLNFNEQETTTTSKKSNNQQEKLGTFKNEIITTKRSSSLHEGCSKVSIGRQLLCELWWKNCPNVCNAHLPTSHHVCTEYCKAVRQNVQSLSRKIIVVNNIDGNSVSNNDENELLSNTGSKNIEIKSQQQQQHLKDVISIHPDCKCKSLLWYGNINDDIHDCDNNYYCKTPTTTNFLIGIGNDPHVPWMIFQVRIPLQIFLPQILLPSSTTTTIATDSTTSPLTTNTSSLLNGISKNNVNIVTPSTRQVQGQSNCTTPRGAIVHKRKNTKKRKVLLTSSLSSSSSMFISPLQLMSTKTTTKPVNAKKKHKGESSDFKTPVRCRKSETQIMMSDLQTPKLKRLPITEIIVTDVSHNNNNSRSTSLIKDTWFQSSAIKSNKSKRKRDFASRTERRERLRRRIFAESSSNSNDRQDNDDHINQFFFSNSQPQQQQHHEKKIDDDDINANKQRKTTDDVDDNDSYNFMHQRMFKKRQKEIRQQQQVQRQQKRELRQQQRPKKIQQEQQQKDPMSHAHPQQEHSQQEQQQQAIDLETKDKAARIPNFKCTEHTHVQGNREEEIESNKSNNVINTTDIVGYKQNESKDDVKSYAIDNAEAAYALLSLTGIPTTNSKNESNHQVDSSQHFYANSKTNSVHDLQQLECQSDIVLLPFTQSDDEGNQRTNIPHGHIYSLRLELDEVNSLSATNEVRNSMKISNNCNHKHNSIDSSSSMFLASDPTEDPPTQKICSKTAKSPATTTTTTNYSVEEASKSNSVARNCHNTIDTAISANNPLSGEIQGKFHEDTMDEIGLHIKQRESLVDHCVIEGRTQRSTDIEVQSLYQCSAIQKRRKLIHKTVRPYSHPAFCSLPRIPKPCSENALNNTVAQDYRQSVSYMQPSFTNSRSMIETRTLSNGITCKVQQGRLHHDFPQSCPLLCNKRVSADGDKTKVFIKERIDELTLQKSAPAGINLQLHDSTSNEVQNEQNSLSSTTEKRVMNNDVYKDSPGRCESSVLSLPFGIQSNLGETEQQSATSACEAFESEHQSRSSKYSFNQYRRVTDLKIQGWLELDYIYQTTQHENESTFRSTMIQLIIAKNQNDSRLWLPALFNPETKIV